MSTQPKPFLTPEQYLEIERKAEYKSEYYRGEMFVMAGAREAHNLIVANVIGELRQQVRSSPCRTYPSDMRVQVGGTGLYTYPDAVVVCNQPKFADGNSDILLNPVVLVEVLSPSTEAYDRGFKFTQYQSIESLKAYVLIASTYMRVDLFIPQSDGSWRLTTAGQAEDVVELQSIGCRLRLADLYEKVELSTAPGPVMRPLPL